MEKINIGIIGLGERGYSLLKSVILEIDYVDVLGVCDIYEDRTERGFDIVAEKGETSLFVRMTIKCSSACPKLMRS